MPRLAVVSNRVPLPDNAGKPAAGGLAVALHAALEKTGGLWFGWSGRILDGDAAADPHPALSRIGAIDYATLDLGRRDWEDYYNGFANQTLWPLFHHRPGLLTINRRTREGYARVNRAFADGLAPLLAPDDAVWIHDYHLIPLGAMLRARLGEGPRLGFFLHIPFPAPDLFAILPNHEELARDLCAYDLAGFHTQADVRRFAEAVRVLAGGSAEAEGEGGGVRVHAFGRSALARAFPISVDTPTLMAQAETAVRNRHARRLEESLAGRRLIVGVDRLDYSKGLPNRLEAFEHLLNDHPEHQGRVSFLQIAPPSREDVPEYAAIRRALSEQAGRINGQFGDLDWVPIRYMNRGFNQRILAGVYRLADVGFVTPLRDGMNLVAKEYVACQDKENPGVLVLSRFAGAAEEMPEAVLVNPFDPEGMADALQRALTMPLEERKERHNAMLRTLLRNDITYWRQSFLAALDKTPVR
jgi:trehalose 6-phosphate synthase